MGASQCAGCCERGVTLARGTEGLLQSLPYPAAEPGACELRGLSYCPPPPKDSQHVLETFLGTRLPVKPRSRPSSPLPSPSAPLTYSTARSACSANGGRPGEPLNKVYVQFSSDLEGFLPYTLIISEAHGLEFTSLSNSPDFALDPMNILRAERIAYDTLMKDAFFVSMSKSILSRPGVQQYQRSPSKSNSIERVRPPYASIVQLNVRRTLLDGGQVLLFLAVQGDLLADELLRSCYRLKKRRAVRNTRLAPETAN